MDKELIIRYLFYFVAAIQIFYIFIFYFKFIFKKNKIDNKDFEYQPVTVIIAARNEAENLQKNLDFFLTQDYPNYQVIVVNDASTDESATVLAEFSLKYKNLYSTNIHFDEKFLHGKKTALTIGVKAAQTDLLLFSDADCRPASRNWIKTIVKNFDEKTNFVIGFGAYEKTKGFLNKIIRYDTVSIALQYFSFALLGIPYMGVGRNMAYRKSYFLKVKGFAKHMNLLSGSDDLFINHNANKYNLIAETNPDSFTISEPKQTFKKWKQQKIRHLTTGKLYKFKHKFLLSLESFSRILFYSLGITLLFLIKPINQNFIIVSSIFVFKILLFLFTLFKTLKKLEQKELFVFGFFYNIFQPLINLFLYLSVNKRKNLIWK